MPDRIARVWIDTDLALGAPSGDVDDGFAIAALAAAHRRGILEILGISTVFGNTSAGRSEECARELVRRAAVSLPILCGAKEPGGGSAAAEAVASLQLGTELLCLGPLTNVAAACRRDPELPARVHLSTVGGNLSSRGFLPPFWPFEFNFARDRESARRVLAGDWSRVTLYPLDVVRSVTVDEHRLDELAEASPLGAYLARGSERWARRARWLYCKRRFPVWDLPAALDLAGVIDTVREARVFSKGTRRLLGSERPFPCLVSFDADQAWRAFLDLLAEPPRLREQGAER